MRFGILKLFVGMVVVSAASGCGGGVAGESGAAEPVAAGCDSTAAAALVEEFGARLNDVALAAPESLVVGQIRDAYAAVVTDGLLEAWIADPRSAPGRLTSSPWPERIDVRSVTTLDAGTCRVDAEVVYVTSTEMTTGGAAYREPVGITLRQNGELKISGYEAVDAGVGESGGIEGPGEAGDAGASDGQDEAGNDAGALDAEAAADVIRTYYDAIDAGEYERAYALWGGEGEASGQTFEAFRSGYEETATVNVDIGEPGRIGAAAGSRYVEIPVVVTAETVEGEIQRFEGSYTLRRSVVDGATPAQRRWHIYTANLNETG